MNNYLLIIFVLTLLILSFGCNIFNDIKIEERTNPYDLENSFGADIISIKTLSSCDGSNTNPSWSPDGTEFVYYSKTDKSLHVLSSSGDFDRKLPRLKGHDAEKGPSWSPEGDKIAYVDLPDWNIWLRDYPDTTHTPLTEDGGCNPGTIVWSPDGTKIAFIQGDGILDGNIRIMDVKTKAKNTLVFGSLFSMVSDWSDDGKLMVISGREPHAYILDIETESLVPLPIGEDTLCWYAIWTNTRSNIIYVIHKNDRREVWMMDENNQTDEHKAVILTNEIEEKAKVINSLCLSKDDSGLLVASSEEFFSHNYILNMEIKMK